MRTLLYASVICFLLALAAVPAHADMRREGEWPDDASERVSLAVDGTRSEALRRLADAAGWSIVGSALKDEPVNVHVTDQPAGKVLALLLGDGNYLVKRDDKLLAISSAPSPKEPAAPAPLALPAPPNFTNTLPAPPPTAAGKRDRGRGKDRTIMGGRTVVAKDEVVADVTVFGGAVEIYGTVSGDASVFGGALTVHPGGHVQGDVTLLGGTVHLADGSRVDGDVSTAGGRIERAAGAVVGGEVTDAGPGGAHVDDHDEDGDHEEHSGKAKADESFSISRAASDVGSGIARTALLFAFGCVLISLAGGRMELMQSELALRPMRAFALGVVGLVAGAFALVALCVTIIGIPLAIIAALLGVLGVYAGMCAAFTTVGAALLHERTPSPYAHLGLGCAVYLLTSSLPFVGWFATAVAVLVGLGLLVETRGAGIFTRHEASAPAVV